MIRIVVLLFCVILSGCVFKGIDSCGFDGEGEGCTPMGVNLQNAIDRSDARRTGTSPDITVQADYTEIDRSLLRDEYARVAHKGLQPQMLSSNQIQLRIYPYSDGERFYDTRDIHILVQRSGWSRGSLIYTSSGVVSLTVADAIPETMKVTASGVNIRTGPSTLFPSIGVIRRNREVYIIQYRDGWYEVEVKTSLTGGTVTGWISGRYLE